MPTLAQSRKKMNGRRLSRYLSAAIAGMILLLPVMAFAESSVLTLDEARQLSLQHNEYILIAREDMTRADRDLDRARSYLYPQLSVTGSAVRRKDISPAMSPDRFETLEIAVDQHVYQMGKVWTGREIAGHYLKEAGLSYSRTVREILFTVTAAYYDVLLGRRSIDIAENALIRAQKQRKQAQARFEVGMVTETAVLRADVMVAQAVEQLERADNQFRVARENLALEMGVAEPPSSIEEPAEGSFPEEPLETLINRALANRLDLQAAEEQSAAAEANIKWERADLFPNIFLQGSYSYTTEPSLYNQHDDNWSASLNLRYPLFTGGRNRAELAVAGSKHRQARLSQQRLKKQIRTEVRSVYLDLQTQRRVLEQYNLQVRSAESNYRQVTAQFEQGLVTAVDQVDAFTILNQTQNQLATAHYTYQLNLVRLQLVTGSFTVPDAD